MTSDRANWLVGGGEMAQVIKAVDWSATPLGPIETWPQSLRTVVSLVQASNSPISLAWGSGHSQIYNDGYWPICGAKHPASMGQDFRECWASAFPVIGEAYRTAWAGHSAYLEKVRMFLDRYGFLEETWFTFSFSPITDETGRVGGLFHPVTELTGQMLSERRTQTVRDLAIHAASARTVEQALELAAGVFAEADRDVPFAVFYLVDATATRARRIAHTGIPADAAGPAVIELDHGASPWSIADAVRGGEAIELEGASHIIVPVGPYPEVPRHVLVLPIRLAGHTTPAAVMVAGVSARLPLTSSYRVFFDLVASAVGGALASARTLEDERRRAEALAEIDRAKTAFFSNVSHEFRTPLTLILGPLEDELAERAAPLPPARRDRIEAAHRNALRLLKLVNTLLDFSRIESGRLKASYEPTDLAAETAQLASVFRAAIEKAGLTLTVACPPLPEPVHVDRDMWEKIVFNLVSNALKHTAIGGITVAQRWDGDRVALQVSDTGVGIAADQLPRVFERFHRVPGAWSRSHEGTGIGLALVRELAGLLGGEVAIASTEGAGTSVTVTIRTGAAHLPADHVRPTGDRSARSAAAFVEEAAHWSLDPAAAPGDAAHPAAPGTRPRVVWADDNADMRDYVTRLLADHVDVVAVGDGEAALVAIRDRLPDLVLSDIMMPRLDGFGLLAALRRDPRTSTVPIVLISARAGSEAASDGMDAGADDYLVKPFSARELVARVRTHVALGRARRIWANELECAYRELEAFSYSVSHDLRAPLRAIEGFSQILLTEDTDAIDGEGRRGLLERIHAASRRMAAIIDDLLALAKVGRIKLHREPTDVTAIALRVVADLRARNPARDVEVQVTEGMAATCDGRLVTIVLENLLANAWKFTGKRAHAEILVGNEDGHVFAVRDNGAGFDMKYSRQLFEPFQRLHTDAEFEGTGIGLAIVRRIIDRHGGQVWLDGAIDRGATVRFTLEPSAASAP